MNFVGVSIERQVIMIGEPEYSIYIPFNQYPCTYDMSFRAVMIDPETEDELALPDFMSFSSEQDRMLQ
jgi:hypothetical protein